jgi:dienelactone hydrolase
MALLLAMLLSAPGDGGVDPSQAASALALELATGRFDAATQRFGDGLAKALPTAALASQWRELTGGLGPFQRVGDVRPGPAPGVVIVQCVYEKAPLHLRVAFDASGRVTGLRPSSGRADAEFEAAARGLVGALVAGQWAKAVETFAPPMAKALPQLALEQAWAQATDCAGAFSTVEAVRLEPSPPFTAADVTCTFAKKALVARVVLDGDLRVSGLFFKPAWSRPDYADPARFTERPLTVGTKALPLPGTLTLPRSNKPVPAVVLVHGSGPNDADESAGPNKPFRDLAWGLATKGIAVLRYPKRTFEYRGRLKDADLRTVKEETLDDAVAALDALSRQPEVDPKRLFVLGHSMGAGLGPRLATMEPRVHGLVLLAGATRKQWHLVVEQRKYLASLKPGPRMDEAIRQAEETAKRLDAPTLRPDERIDGAPGEYWLDMRNDDPPATAAKLTIPMLILQGERDYQVTMTDFAGWKQTLAGRKNVTLKSYPALNHLFLPGAGQSSPDEYEQPGHIPVEVVDDLAKWLLSH